METRKESFLLHNKPALRKVSIGFHEVMVNSSYPVSVRVGS